MGRLASSTIDWQRRLATRLAHTPHAHSGSPRTMRLLWAGSGIAAALLIAGAVLLWWTHTNSPERLLASVYGRDRVFALRVPGAVFAPVTPQTHLRGGPSGREPAELLDARAQIERHLERSAQDPHWLELEARSDILEENFDPAVDILDRLTAAGPASPELLGDAAMAYFQRGLATESESDCATALDYLRRADEMAPGDPVILFNEAVVMEDRGQLINAEETWKRFLHFERDAAWLAEGRSRLGELEQKLNRMKSHESRMEQRLATPEAMRALAGDSAALAAVDEELSTSLLPRLLYSAYGSPTDRSRGSPCAESCQAARTLLGALAASLDHHHHDPWLARFLPPGSETITDKFIQAVRLLGQAIDADQFGDFPAAARSASASRQLFKTIDNAAGADRAAVEEAYALQREFHFADCRKAARDVLDRQPQFAWIQSSALTEDGICNTGPGTATANPAIYERILNLARNHGYALLALRTRTTSAGSAFESGDAEETWRIDLPTVRSFYGGDYPPIRLANTLAGLAEVEETTPRVHLALLLKREYLAVLEMTEIRNTIPAERIWLASTAIRAGSVREAEDQMRLAQSEQAAFHTAGPFRGLLAEDEIAMAVYYIGRGGLIRAEELLDAAKGHLAGDDDFVHARSYATARGELELAMGHREEAERVLRDAILDEERQGAHVGTGNVIFAMEDRNLYAVLAGVWMARKRPGEDILALWERYRLRALGEPVAACAGESLDCLKPEVQSALKRMGPDELVGQVVLPDRVLVYRGTAEGVEWSSIPISQDDLLAAVGALERAVNTPVSSMESFDEAARRAGDSLFRGDERMPGSKGQMLIEPDPLLGNLPWPAVAVSGHPMGLSFNLEEMPSLLLAPHKGTVSRTPGNALVVAASVAVGDEAPLPEAVSEADEVAQFVRAPKLLVGSDATEAQVSAAIANAPSIHFAGHALERAGETRLLLAGGEHAGRPYLDSALFRAHPPRAARLVVFSACSSGKREEGWNHDMGDIVGTLAALGVPEVVATRWQIDSAAAVPIMDAFYGGLAEGLTVSQALTQARLTIRRDPTYRHPYYWAAYYASGAGRNDLREVIHGKRK